MTFSPETLRSELLPSSQLEELFFDTIVRLSTCAHFLVQHIERDPEFTNPETVRRMRLLLTTESKLRYAFEEFRRLKVARQIQLEDPGQAARPVLAVVATHTTRNGFRTQPRHSPPPDPFLRQIQQYQLDDARGDAKLDAEYVASLEPCRRKPVTEAGALASAPYVRPETPGRNAPCPCNSGRKYKHCCLNRTAAVSERTAAQQAA